MKNSAEIVGRVSGDRFAILIHLQVSGVSEEKNEAGFLRYKMTREGIEQMVADPENGI